MVLRLRSNGWINFVPVKDNTCDDEIEEDDSEDDQNQKKNLVGGKKNIFLGILTKVTIILWGIWAIGHL